MRNIDTDRSIRVTSSVLAAVRDNRQLVLRVLGVAIVAAATFIAFWPDAAEGPAYITGSGPVYESVESLSEEADLIVIGVVKSVNLRQTEESTGLPFVYFDFAVEEVVRGPSRIRERDTIVVSTLDTDQVVVDTLTPLEVSQKVLLFLEEIRAADAPTGLVPFDRVFVPLSDDNGVFDVVDNNEVRARSDAVLATTEAGVDAARQNLPQPEVGEDGREIPAQGLKQSFSINDLRGIIQR